MCLLTSGVSTVEHDGSDQHEDHHESQEPVGLPLLEQVVPGAEAQLGGAAARVHPGLRHLRLVPQVGVVHVARQTCKRCKTVFRMQGNTQRKGFNQALTL